MRKLLFPEVVRSSVWSSAIARDKSVNRTLFSLSLSPYSSLCKYFFFSFTELQINIYFCWRNVCGGCDLVPNSSMQENTGGHSLSLIHGRFMCFWENPESSNLQSIMLVAAGLIIQVHELPGRILAQDPMPHAGMWCCTTQEGPGARE